MSITWSPTNGWKAEDRTPTELSGSLKAFHIVRVADGTQSDLQELCHTLGEKYIFNAIHDTARKGYTLICHNDPLDLKTRELLAKAGLIPPLTPPPEVSLK